jgi:hypothetical protein
VLWYVVATDKLAATIFKGYKAAVDMYGHPICIQLDYGAEHSLVQEDQERARPDVIKRFLTGSSVHNQVDRRSSTLNRRICIRPSSWNFLTMINVVVED